jgi:arylsulfatase A-like enzyme
MKIYQLPLLIYLFIINISPLMADSIPTKPNIVLILADDVALMDFGIYGGEAATPNIDRLANKGTIFTNYHASPMCAPSRAMLLTGYDSHLTGVPNLPLFLPEEYMEKTGYEGVLNNKVQTIGTRLKNHGYNTYVTGKWHLGHTENSLPTKRGFDRSYILDASGADNYEHKAYLPTQSKPMWIEDGKEVDLPDDFYSSRFLVDKMMSFMNEEENDEDPFFAFLSFQAVHIPVQAPKKYIERYKGVYDNGWGELRLKRFENAKKLGLIPADAPLADMLPMMKKWDDLSEEDKKLKAKAMAVNAAMLEAMDDNIGRYINYLEEKGKLDNTIFIITSDNGPEASDPSLVKGMGLWLKSVGYHTDYEKLGEKGSWNFIGPEFGSAAASPSSFFKFYSGEGGLRVPLIISGVGLPVQKETAFSFITDVTPTIMELVGISDDKNADNPMTGRSLYPLLTDEVDKIYQIHEPIIMEAGGQIAIFKGDFKLVKTGKPYGDEIWRIFNIKNDPGETIDLSTSLPEFFQELKEDYKVYAADVGVLEMPENYEVIKEVERKFKKEIIKKVLPWIIGFIALFIIFRVLRKRRKKNKHNGSGY